MARAIWSGAISFGLVSVPVKAFSASKDHSVHFHQVQKGTGSRINYKKVAEKSGREVKSDDIDPVYFEKTYWLAPDGDPATRAYRLLLEAMESEGRVGIGTVVMRRKQYLACIRPLDGALAMSTMRFADEVIDKSEIDAIPSRRAKPDKKELALAHQIIDALASDFDPTKYKDTYTAELRKIIKQRSEGKEVKVEAPPAADENVLDLMAALEASVDAAKQARTSRTAKPRRRKSA